MSIIQWEYFKLSTAGVGDLAAGEKTLPYIYGGITHHLIHRAMAEETISSLGNEGWEMTSAVYTKYRTCFWFKRPKCD